MKAFKKIKVCDKLQEVSNLEKAMEVNPASATPAQEGLMWQPGNVKTHQMILLRNIINGKKNVLKKLISYLFITFVRIYYMGNFFFQKNIISNWILIKNFMNGLVKIMIYFGPKFGIFVVLFHPKKLNLSLTKKFQ